MRIRAVEKSDLPKIQRLNEAEVPHVNSIEVADFSAFVPISSFFVLMEDDAKLLVGFMIVLGPGQNYESPNYQYFNNKYTHFDYVDRIVIAKEYQSKGFGSAFYKYLRENSSQESITCEVNLVPPNPTSIAFHTRLGFTEVAQQQTDAGKKRVSLMVAKRLQN